MRKKLAWKAYQHCASYDSVVAEYLWSEIGDGAPAPELSVPMTLMDTLRYGENRTSPRLYADASLAESRGPGSGARRCITARRCRTTTTWTRRRRTRASATSRPRPAGAAVKHTNPCGVASASGCGGDVLEAYRQAVRADPISAFGGIVAFNREFTEAMAKELREFRCRQTTDAHVLRDRHRALVHPEGLATLKGKSKNLRILEVKPRLPSSTLRQVGGGWLQQSSDSPSGGDRFTVVSETKPTKDQLDALKFAWRCVKHVKSNAITVATKGRLPAWEAGSPTANSVRIALEERRRDEGSVPRRTRSSSSRGATRSRSRARRA